MFPTTPPPEHVQLRTISSPKVPAGDHFIKYSLDAELQKWVYKIL